MSLWILGLSFLPDELPYNSGSAGFRPYSQLRRWSSSVVIHSPVRGAWARRARGGKRAPTR